MVIIWAIWNYILNALGKSHSLLFVLIGLSRGTVTQATQGAILSESYVSENSRTKSFHAFPTDHTSSSEVSPFVVNKVRKEILEGLPSACIMFMCGQHTRLPLLPFPFRERQRQTERTELKPPPSPGVFFFPAVPHVWLAGSSRVLQAPSPSGTSSKTTLPVGRHGCWGDNPACLTPSFKWPSYLPRSLCCRLRKWRWGVRTEWEVGQARVMVSVTSWNDSYWRPFLQKHAGPSAISVSALVSSVPLGRFSRQLSSGRFYLTHSWLRFTSRSSLTHFVFRPPPRPFNANVCPKSIISSHIKAGSVSRIKLSSLDHEISGKGTESSWGQ